MKKLLTYSLSALMMLSLAACGDTTTTPAATDTADTTATTITSEPFVATYSTDIDRLDYTVTSSNTNQQHLANFVDGLLENDSKGNFVPCLAEDYEANEDSTVWTYHLREGVKWFTSDEEEYAEVTAQDFVTGLQHAADSDSEMIAFVQGVIVGLDDYVNGVTTDFSTVGVKAVDDYTVEYTLTGPVTYFDTMATYSILYPVNQEFLESQGEGCKLGAYDVETCSFGTVDPDSILYNGGYYLTTNTTKSKIEYTKNEEYWDAEHIYVPTVTYLYDDGSDTHSVINGFKQGTYTAAGFNASWDDYDDLMEEYEGYVSTQLPDSYTLALNFNFNRTAYQVTGHETDEEKAATKEAILNLNFRKAVMAAFDRVTWNMQTSVEEVAKAKTRNTWSMGNLVKTSTGESYGSLVDAKFNEIDEDFGDVSLADGENTYYNPDLALEFIERAKEDGISFPVTLDLISSDNVESFIKRSASLKESIETATNGQILINIIQLNNDDRTTYTYYSYDDLTQASYDINTSILWGPDYLDPKTMLNCYAAVGGDFQQIMGLLDYGSEDAPEGNDEVIEQIGLLDIYNLSQEADAITGDNDARYEKYAEAEATLLENAICVPITCYSLSQFVSKAEPFTKEYSVSGNGKEKFKGMIINSEMTTAEDYAAAEAEFLN